MGFTQSIRIVSSLRHFVKSSKKITRSIGAGNLRRVKKGISSREIDERKTKG
jgi:hypothetical protein